MAANWMAAASGIAATTLAVAGLFFQFYLRQPRITAAWSYGINPGERHIGVGIRVVNEGGTRARAIHVRAFIGADQVAETRAYELGADQHAVLRLDIPRPKYADLDESKRLVIKGTLRAEVTHERARRPVRLTYTPP